MGIYTNGIVYGIRISKYIDDLTEANILFERKDVVRMSLEKLQEAKLFYESLVDKNNLLFSTYIEYSSTYNSGEGVFKNWTIISLDTFLALIGI